MSYKNKIFTRYGSPCDYAEVNIYGYLNRAENCKTFAEVTTYDNSAAQLIAKCERMIALLRDYRQDLAARYSALATMPSKDIIKLQRLRKYNSNVVYYIRFFTEYEDGTKVETATETYPGVERHKALKRFEELKRQHPGIETVVDIEKSPWER